MPDASPTKWHLAHTTWFFETMVLGRFDPFHRPVDERYAYLFNSYYEALGERQPRPRRGLITRPTLDEVHAYRRAVDASMDRFLRSDPRTRRRCSAPSSGLHHEQQHQELILTDIQHALWCNPLRPAYVGGAGASAAHGPRQRGLGHLRRRPGRDRARTARGFAFDNEAPRHRVFLEAYALADRPVRAASTPGSSPTAAIAGPSSGCPTGGRRCRPRAGRRPPTGSGATTSGGSSRWRGCGPSIPRRRSATSATSRPTPLPAGRARGCPPRPSGSTPRMAPPTAATSSSRGGSGRRPPRRRRRCARCSATSGSGRRAPTCPTRGSCPWPASSASTTASSCPGRWCCAADRASRRVAHPPHVPQLLPARRALADVGLPPRALGLRIRPQAFPGNLGLGVEGPGPQPASPLPLLARPGAPPSGAVGRPSIRDRRRHQREFAGFLRAAGQPPRTRWPDRTAIPPQPTPRSRGCTFP